METIKEIKNIKKIIEDIQRLDDLIKQTEKGIERLANEECDIDIDIDILRKSIKEPKNNKNGRILNTLYAEQSEDGTLKFVNKEEDLKLLDLLHIETDFLNESIGIIILNYLHKEYVSYKKKLILKLNNSKIKI